MQQAPEAMTLKVIAHIHTAFPTKFGIPRQSGLVEELRGEIIFTPEYRNPDALRGLEDFSHIWLVWQFSGAVRESWSPTVRPPRLGGNTRVGVFATRSPFRPNPLGLSSVKLEAIEQRPDVGPVLIVRGADLMDGTPIYDIKPYIPTPTATRTPPRALPGRPAPTIWKCPALKRCGRPYRKPTAPRCRACLPVTPAPPTSTTRSGCTAWSLPGWRCILPWTVLSSPCETSPCYKRSCSWNCGLSIPFCTSLSCTAFPALRGSWATRSRRCPPKLHSWKPNWAPRCLTAWQTVRLTDAGQTFLGYARTLLETAQQAQAALQPAQQVRGSLRIALADSVCSTFLPGLLQRYHARCPQVELVLHTASTDEMLQLLSTNQVDLVYTLDQPLLQPALVLAADVPEPVCFIAPPQHPLAQESTIPLDLLPRQEFLLTERGMSYRDALDQCMAAHGLAIHPYLELGSAALLCQMVEQGMGLSFLPEYIVRSALAEGRLARLNVPDCTVMMHRQLFYHRDKWVTPQMNVFIELVQQQ